MLKQKYFWFIAFPLILVVSMIYLFWEREIALSLWGFPTWIYGFLAIELVFCLLMWLFVHHFWTKDENID